MRAVFLLAALAAFGAQAAPPSAFQFQTRLLDATGTPVSGPHVLTFTIYGSAGALWTETHTNLDVQQGYVSVALGTVTPFPTDLWDDGPRELGIALDGGAELSPRTTLLAVPFAQTAAQVPTAASEPVACSAATAGRLYFDSALRQLRACNGAFWTGVGGSANIGDSAETPAQDCADVIANRPTATTGTYWIDPDGAGMAFTPMQVWCDMTPGNAGWTLCSNFIDTAGDDLVNSVGAFSPARKDTITGGVWLTGATTIANLSQSGTFDCIDAATAVAAAQMRVSCEGGGTSFDSGPLTYDASALTPGQVAVDGYTFDTHAEWYWGGYGTRSWLVTTSASGYAHCAGNSCGANGMGWDDGPTRIEIVGGGGDGCANGCSYGDIYYTGTDEGANCNGQSMRGVAGDRYSIWIR